MIADITEARSIAGQTAHEPDVVIDARGDPWIVWTERSLEGERIRFGRLRDPAAAIVVSGEPGIHLQPAIALIGEGSGPEFLIAWASRRGGRWHLMSSTVKDDASSAPESIVSAQDGLFHARLISDGTAGCILAAEKYAGGSSRLILYSFDGSAWRELDLETPDGDCFRPCLSRGPSGGVWLAYDCYREGCYGVYIQRIDEPSKPIEVAQDGFQNVQPDLASDADGNLWIAWSSNRNERGDAWWLTKYVSLARFDGATIEVPPNEMPGRDLFNEDAWQGWEFPAVTVDRTGRVWLFGQASHTLVGQYLDGNGWSERFDIAPRRWGSWKPRTRVVGDDPVYVVSMGLGGAQWQRLNVPSSKFQVPSCLAPTPDPSSLSLHSSFEGPRLRLFFGDLHCHSAYGDACSDVDEIYHRYRDAYGYDFAALTEHDYLDGMELSRSELEMMWAHADRITEPGRFVAMYGYEWTSPALADHAGPDGSVGEGHRHVIYPDQTGPLISYGESSAKSARALLDRLAGRRALVVQHHTGWSGTNWDAYDPNLSRLIEICSTHGRFEFEGNRPIGYRRDHVHPGKFVVDGLNRGLRFGFIGGSDSHGLIWHARELEGRSRTVPAGTRVGWKEDPFRTGMTAILAPELTREALFEALHNRRCYATSGVPIELDFRVDGEMMGSEIEVSDRPRISANVRGTEELEIVQIVRSGKAFFSRSYGDEVRTHDAHIELLDHMMEPGESHYYYFRVIQRDGNMAWSSPIWVDWVE